MKIAVESTVVLQDYNLKRLKEVGEIIVYDFKSSKEEFLRIVKQCEIIVANKKFYNEVISQLNVKLISVWGTGYNIIDIIHCKKLGITVTNVPSYGINSVAELTFALIMGLTKKVIFQYEKLKKGKWAYNLSPVSELKGKTIGIIGFGNIGKKVAQIASSFEMNVLINTRVNKQNEFPNYEFVQLNELLKKSDFVTIHVPLLDDTKHLISKKQLETMKKSSFLINTSRGAIINETDLYWALKNGIIAGAGLDVYTKEPLPIGHDFLKLGNVILTPHSGYYTYEALERLSTVCIENIIDYLAGKATNVVNSS